MAVLVVIIHTGPLLSYSRVANGVLVQIIARVAVPFFFVAAGYFFFLKFNALQNSRPAILRDYLKHLLSLYVTWSGIYLLTLLAIGLPMPWQSPDWGWSSWWYMGCYGLLWFFLVLLISISVITLLTVTTPLKVRIAVFGLLYLGYFIPVLPVGVGVYCTGMALVGSGALLSEVRSIPPSKWYLPVCLGAFLGEAAVWLAIDRCNLHMTYGMFGFFGLPAALALFAFGLNWRVPVSAAAGYWLRQLSTYLYVSHGIVVAVYLHYWSKGNSLVYFCIIIGVSVALSSMIIQGKNIYKRWVHES